MKTYIAHEYRVTDTELTPTGRTEDYPARTIRDAVAHYLYTHTLHNGKAKVGPSGLTVYCGALAYALTGRK